VIGSQRWQEASPISRIKNKIGWILKFELGISQADFAAQVGINRTYLGKIMRGDIEPGVLKAKKIAQALGKTVGEIWPDDISREEAIKEILSDLVKAVSEQGVGVNYDAYARVIAGLSLGLGFGRPRKLSVIDYETSYVLTNGGKPFRCSCKCNCFHHEYEDKTIFTCNACGKDHKGEPKEGV